MRIIKFLLIGVFITGTVFLSSCKKETRIERNLWNNDGEWNIESLIVDQVSTNTADNYHETIYNFGTFTFKKDGSGISRITVDGDVETGTFTYSNTKDKLTLIIDNEARIFDMDWEKNELTLTIVESYTDENEYITYTEIVNLKKK